jgi:hypothetical protein
MDDARLQRRIHVVVVTTRAAASSLVPGNGEVRAAVQRGILMLDGMTEEVARAADPATSDQLAEAKLELASLMRDGST